MALVSFGRSTWIRTAALAGGLTCGLLMMLVPVQASDWPQFRGVNSSGRAVGMGSLPTQIGPTAPTVWVAALPPGHSSPAIAADRLFVTGVRDQKLVTIALDRASGKQLWEVEAPHEKLETIHSIGSHAQSSPATDGERVVSFFGSSGLFCYDRDGKLLWQHRMGPFNNDFGAASSPILVGDKVILCQDHDTGSFLMAFDKRTGAVQWKTDRSEFPRNYCTPVVWRNGDQTQLVVAATLRVVGYDLATGREQWTVRGISRTVCMTPVVGDDDWLYVAGWAAGGDKESPIRIVPFAEVVASLDADKNGKLEEKELPEGPVKQRFTQIDRNNDDGLDAAEYEYFRELLEKGRNVVIAIRPGPSGEATATHLAWESDRFVPFCASPLFTNGLIFTVKDGGIVSCLDAQTGKMHKSGRLPHTDNYYASPVAGDGKVYFVNQEGQLSVVSADRTWKPLHTAEFGEEVYATPALVDGRVYLRTASKLYCFP
ncbi:MAG: PQQ-binding-like beta-propeller repeat protein [Pirellulales bacterium]